MTNPRLDKRRTRNPDAIIPARGRVMLLNDTVHDAAPPAYQAAVLRRQIADDLNRKFWNERVRLMRAISDRKEAVERDHAKLSATDFLARYRGWDFT